MSRLAKFLLIATSLSPLLGAVTIKKWANGEAWWWVWLAMASLCCALGCRSKVGVIYKDNRHWRISDA